MDMIPFDDRDGKIWFNGEMVNWRDAKTHALNHGLHYASSVFEGERAYNGEIFENEWHTRRFRESAGLLDFELPYTDEELIAAKAEVMAANGLTDCYIRPVAWRGSEMMAVSAQYSKTHVLIAAWEWGSYFDPELKMKGITLDIADWKRPSPESAPVHAKAAGLYMICTLSKHAAEKNGFTDALMMDYRGYIAEATGANVFFLMNDGKIHTPNADCFLNGITRQTVVKLLEEMGYDVVERHITPDELANVTECFLTGTAAEVTPVSQIGDHSFNPGGMCRSVMDAYAKLVRGEA
ncbi:MAG: branched-chain amino acid aminotransferase [Alphaproteobacteria bacterium]|nr:branched-chain amino acid aminotransferase [Alphaproteobacteria bacterium]